MKLYKNCFALMDESERVLSEVE